MNLDPRKWLARSNYPLTIDQLASFFTYQGSSYPMGLNMTYTGGAEEKIVDTFSGYAMGGYAGNPVVFACMAVRMMLFAEARFQFQRIIDGRPGELFGTQELAILEHPWPNGTTGDLLSRAVQDVDVAGNFYCTRDKDRLWRLRPDWVTIVLGSYEPPSREGTIGAELVGYLYQYGGTGSKFDPVAFLPEEVSHWAPYPDPLASYRGMSWLTPLLRELLADKAMTSHRLKFFEGGATPNMIVTLDPAIQGEAFKTWVKLLSSRTEGVANAYKTMYLGGGANAQVVGTNLRQLDFKTVQGAGETRIAAAAQVPAVIVGLSEGLEAATYSNYAQARRRLADGTLRPLWRNFAASMENMVKLPSAARLWYDDRDISFVKEDVKDRADILLTQAQTMRTLVDAGYVPDDVALAVGVGDLSHLKHSGLFSVQLQPPGPNEPPSDGGTAPSPNGSGDPAKVGKP